MMNITSDSIDSLYKESIDLVLSKGEEVTARNLEFIELSFQHLVLTNPRARIIQNSTRNVSLKFMVAEFIWIMSGQSDLDMISFYNKNMSKFSDNGISLSGAYGPRLRRWGQPSSEIDQLENCLQRLKNDLYTRQAAIVILNPSKDFVVKTKDIPCNNYLQFLCRNNKLSLLCYVRSNDLMLGFPYDVFHWTMLQEMFASILNVELGDYHHIVGSLHIYKNDIVKMRNILKTHVEHIPMKIMPELRDLSIIDRLGIIEEEYRKNDSFNFLGTNIYWQNLLSNLRIVKNK